MQGLRSAKHQPRLHTTHLHYRRTSYSEHLPGQAVNVGLPSGAHSEKDSRESQTFSPPPDFQQPISFVLIPGTHRLPHQEATWSWSSQFGSASQNRRPPRSKAPEPGLGLVLSVPTYSVCWFAARLCQCAPVHVWYAHVLSVEPARQYHPWDSPGSVFFVIFFIGESHIRH